MNGTHHLLVYADVVHVLGGSTYTINKKHSNFSSR